MTEPMPPDANLDDELDRLYGLDPAEFVAGRDRLARELRTEERREEAEEVKGLRKPTLSAWTVNQLARQERRDVDLLLDAGHRLREAQQGVLAGSDRKSLDEARATERDALGSLRRAAGRILADAGRGGESALAKVMRTLQAAAVSAEGRELLARGRFTGDLEETGFELLAPLAEGAPHRRPERKRARKPPQRDKGRLKTARAQLSEARSAARSAEKELREAERDADKARRALALAEERVNKRKKVVSDAQAALEQAEKQLGEAGEKS